jgi:hypothetical protein
MQNDFEITDFLKALYADENKTINLMITAPRGAKKSINLQKITSSDLSEDSKSKEELKEINKSNNISFFLQPGGTRIEEIEEYVAFSIHNSKLATGELRDILNKCPLPPSIAVQTDDFVQAYWLINGICSESEWREVQSILISYFKSDRNTKYPTNTMKLPCFNYVTVNPETKELNYQPINIVVFNPEKRFTVNEMKKALSSEIRIKTNSLNSLNSFQNTGVQMTGIEKIFSKTREESAKSDSLMNLESLKNIVEIHNKAKKVDCFYGLAGEIVDVIEPHTEADPLGLLLTVFVMFGNLIGRKTYFEADGSKHYTNLFAVLVGSTTAGKGTSFAQIRRLFEMVDLDWSKTRIQSGLSSGEGLIYAVRNKVEGEDDDEGGNDDKRLLVVESEFASVLSMNRREGNTLSPVIRNLWDDGSAQTLTKNNPTSTNDAQISIIGHITPDELKHCLGRTEISNGFANRFLWLYVKRSKSLPDDSKVSDEVIDSLVLKLREAIEFSQNIEEMKRDESAQNVWRENYEYLTREKRGAFGNATTRARPQVVRLSIIYALLDKSNVIKAEHLKAALDLWRHCENSAKAIFGDSTTDKLSNEILEFLRDNPKGLTKTEIHNLKKNNISAIVLDRTLKSLKESYLINFVKKEREGKSIEVWYANEFYEFNELKEEVVNGESPSEMDLEP